MAKGLSYSEVTVWQRVKEVGSPQKKRCPPRTAEENEANQVTLIRNFLPAFEVKIPK